VSVTAYHSFAGEVEASNTPTIRHLTLSRRHQLSPIAHTLGEPVLNYLKNYVAITVGGNNYMWLHKRTLNKSLLSARMDQSLQDDAAAILDAGNVAYVRKPKSVRIVVDKEMIEKNAELFKNLAALVKRSWEGGA
jgi:hypothetical protein